MKAIAGGAFILCMIAYASGLQCYSCNVTDGSVCTTDQVVDCFNGDSLNTNSLMKRVCTKDKVGPKITRDCKEVEFDAEMKCKGTLFSSDRKCNCNSKLCNGSAGFTGSFFWTIRLVTITTIVNLIFV